MVEKPPEQPRKKPYDTVFLKLPDAFSDRWAEAGVTSSVSLFHEDQYLRRTLLSPAELQLALSDEKLTNFGKALKKVVQGRAFVDLGCGDPSISMYPRIIAEQLGASEYAGVDIRFDQPLEVRQGEFFPNSHFESRFIQGDLLAYVKELPNLGGRVFYLSGLEPKDLLRDDFVPDPESEFELKRKERDQQTREYITTLINELSAKMKSGDAVVVGIGTHGFDFEEQGFDLLEEIKVVGKHGDPVRVGAIYSKR